MLFMALGIDVAVTGLVLVANLWAIGVLDDINSRDSLLKDSTLKILEFWGNFRIVMYLTAIGVGLAIVRWLGACYAYAKDTLNATGFVHEQWKLWGWILPLMNLFKPYQVLNEIYKVGAPDMPGGEEWKKSSGSGMLLSWWVFWVIAHFVIIQWLIRLSKNDVPPGGPTLIKIIDGYYFSIIFCIASIILAGLWFLVAGNLTRRLMGNSSALKSMPKITNVAHHSSRIANPQDALQKDPSREVDATRIYAQVAEEIESGTTDKGLWVRMWVESEGDDKQTKVKYIKQRVDLLLAAEKARLLEAQLQAIKEKRLYDAAIQEKLIESKNIQSIAQNKRESENRKKDTIYGLYGYIISGVVILAILISSGMNTNDAIAGSAFLAIVGFIIGPLVRVAFGWLDK